MTWSPPTFHRFRDAIRRGDASVATGRFRDAVLAFTEALVARGEDLTPDQEADLRNRIAAAYLECGDLDAADLALAPAARLDAARVLPGTAGETRSLTARIAMTRGDYETTIAEATAAWELLRTTGENVRLARALNVRGHGHRQTGALDLAREDYSDALAAARRAGDDHQAGLACANLGSLLWLRGGYREARSYHRRAVEHHERSGSDLPLTRELFSLAVDEFHCGDWTQVDALLTRVRERLAHTEDARLECASGLLRARLDLARGRDPRAAVEAARRIAETNGYDHDLIVAGQILGDAAWERGDLEEAERVLGAAFDRATASAPEGEAAVDTAWRLALVEHALGDPRQRAEELLDFAVATAGTHGYRTAGAAARRALGSVLAAAGQAAEARAHLDDALDIYRTLELPYETGRTLSRIGRLCAESVTDVAAAPGYFRNAATLLTGLGAERERARAEEGLAESLGEGEPFAVRPESGDPFAEIVTESDLLHEATGRARRIAPSDIPVLVTGETGTGKELFARAIHAASKRRERPFLAVNCAALTETLLEAELFGHVKGAFTGAMSGKAGIFEAAHGGTVFLDEIGKAPPSLQAKLLRVLDTGEVRRVGGTEAMHVKVRIVAATNRNLHGMVETGEFLPDLLYRLRGYEITVPPLRDRAGDVAHLFRHFAGRPASRAALDLLEAHDWPGNVREVRNVAESAAFLTPGRGPIPADALPDGLRAAVDAGAEAEWDADGGEDLTSRLEGTERQVLARALLQAGGNRSAAARRLGVSRQTLYTKMSKYGLGAADAA